MSDSVSGFFCSEVCLWESTMIMQTAIACLFSLRYGVPIYEYIVQQLIHPFHCWWYLGCFHFMMIINNGTKTHLYTFCGDIQTVLLDIHTHKESTSIKYTDNTSLSK